MALPDGLNEAETADYLATIAGYYEQQVRIEVLTNERRVLSTISAALIDGQVDCMRVEVDWFSEDKSNQEIGISRYAKNITLYDPSHAIALDSGSPADGALYLDRSIRIIVSVRGRLRWYDVPVFTGPITDLEREGALITLEAEGCESFGQGAAWRTDTLKNMTKVEAFKRLMYETGEVDEWMDVPTSREKLVAPKVIARDTRRWDKAFFIMASMNRLCFYDGYGRCRTPVPDTDPVMEFGVGDNGLLLAEPGVRFSTDGFRNHWWQLTSTAKGKDIEAGVPLPASHPLTPIKIGRNGKPKYLLGSESNPDLRTKAKAYERGKTLLAQASSETHVRGECRPVWHLSPFDWALMRTAGWAMPFPVAEFSLPLAGGQMTLGYQDNLAKPAVDRIRRS